MDASVLWKGGMTFTGTADTGFTVPLGADPAVGGDNDGFRPMELMAVSLAGCTAMDVISIVRKKRQQVTAYEVKVHAERAEQHPKVFTSAVIEYEVTGHDVDEKAVRRAIELSTQTYCPAQGMLHKVMPIQLHYAIYEGDSTEDRELVTRGEWTPDA
ncbi:MAG: OsmC family protein [Gemmatimonadota bacterium]|jgi:putative redox protein